MAKAAQKKEKKEKAPGNPLAIMRLLKVAGFVLCILAAVVLFGASFDLGFTDLRFELREFALAAFAGLVVGLVMVALSGSRVAAGERSVVMQELENLKAQVADQNAVMEINIAARVAPVEEKVQTFLGAEYERMKAENEEFRVEIEQQRSLEMTRTNAEIEHLRERNEMLQEKISKWAIDSVDSAVTNDRIHDAADKK